MSFSNVLKYGLVSQGAFIDPTLLYWYKFNDASNSGTLGASYPLKRYTCSGSVYDDTISTYVRNGYCGISGGTASFISTNNYNAFPQYKSSTFSMSVWVQNFNTTYANFGTPVELGFAIAGYTFYTDNILIFRHQPLNSGDKKWYVQFYNGIGGCSDTIFTTSTNTAANTNVTMLTVTLTASVMKFYLNGTYQAQDTDLCTPKTPPYYYNSYIKFGVNFNQSTNSAVYPYNGKIFDFKLYNKTLSDAEVTALYNAGVPS